VGRDSGEKMGRRILEYVEIDQDSQGTNVYKCTCCGFVLGPSHQSFKQYAVVKERSYSDYVDMGVLSIRSDRFVIREFYCPKCAIRFDVESVVKGEPYLDIKISED
jgi:acetone carboxylase gamma subunit